jgi:hypothetical protein
LIEKEAHGGIDVLIGARDEISLLLQNACKGGHGSAANAHEMDSTDTGGKFVEIGRKIRVSGWNRVF